jgi:hypothetical protein
LRSRIFTVQDFGDCYAVLGLPADTEWDVLRPHYRRLIHQWHPDRFAADSVQQRLAEERIKQITAAYQALDKYRRDHGVLPPAGTAAMPVDDRRSAWGQSQESDVVATDDSGDGRMGDANAFGLPTRGRWRWGRAAIAVAVLIAVMVIAVRNLDWWSRKSGEADESVAEQVDTQLVPRLADRLGEQRGIAIGSTIGDVHAIQGIPTATQGNTWYYGKSQVHFAQGTVISWDEDPGYPLRIARNQPSQLHDGKFRFGSTKDEVRAVQGAPVTETATVWDYGLSRVYFENNRVVRWEDSPMQRLRVSR